MSSSPIKIDVLGESVRSNKALINFFSLFSLTAPSGIDLSIYQFIDLTIHRFIDLSIFRFIDISIYRSKMYSSSSKKNIYCPYISELV